MTSSEDVPEVGDARGTGAESPPEGDAQAPRPARAVVIVLVVATLALGVLLDVLRPESGSSSEGETAAPVQQVFHCPDTPTGEQTETEIYVASNSDTDLSATVDIVSDADEEPNVAVPVDIPARGTAIVKVSDHSEAAGAASVTVPAGEIAVEAKVVRTGGGIEGVATYPCPAAGARTWRFATGSTAKGVLEFVYVYNPTDEQVVFDVNFKSRNAGETAAREETPLGGLTLAPHRRMKIAVHENVIRRDEVAVSVHAQRGTIVVSNSLLPGGGANGFGSTLGMPSPAKRMFFTGGRATEGQNEAISVLNETEKIGLVTVLSYPDSGTDPIPPKDLEFPAASVSALDLTGVSDVGPSVANELEADVEASADQLRTSNNDQALVTPLLGTARVWLLPSSPADPAEGFVELVNPGDREIKAKLYLLSTEGSGSLDAVGDPIEVPAGTRVGIATPDLGIDAPGGLLVVFDGGGLVGHGYFEQGDWAITTGIPVR